MLIEQRPNSSARGIAEVARFIGTGAMSNVVYFAVLGVLVWLFVKPLWLYAGIAYLTSAVANYLLHHTVTFRSKARHSFALSRYVPVQAVALLTNSWLLDLLVSKWGLHYVLGQFMALVITTTWSYFHLRG
jgi:putative flippase GtrA